MPKMCTESGSIYENIKVIISVEIHLLCQGLLQAIFGCSTEGNNGT